MLHFLRGIKEVIKIIPNGITKPVFAYLEDSTLVVYKRERNDEGPRVLANEFVSYHIAKALGLPIPDAGCAVVDDDTVVPDEVLTELDCSKLDFLGLGFYSVVREKVTQLTAPEIVKCEVIIDLNNSI